MSYFDKMIVTENIPGSYEAWEDYREELTECLEEFCPVGRRSGVDNKCKVNTGRPVLALWGIGQAGDIDLGRLAKKYKLVLIDRDEQAATKAAGRYGLEEGDYVISDIPFWRIDDDEYRFYEALLEDCADVEHVLDFLRTIAENNSGKYIGRTEHEDADRYMEIFDYSAAVGLHSQLNSRFAALLYYYRSNYHEDELRMISSAIAGLNEAAVERLNDYMYHMTKTRIIYGYEAAVCENYHEAGRISNLLDEKDADTIKSFSQVQGASQLMRDLSLHIGCDVELADSRHIVWPFDVKSGKKNYVMGLVALDKLD